MATKRPRIAAYLPEPIHEKFKQYATERKLGDSQALAEVLSDYFGVGYKVTHSELPEVLERVDRLESSLSSIRSDLLDELKRAVLAELAPQALMVAIPASQVKPDMVFPEPDVIDVVKVDEAPQALGLSVMDETLQEFDTNEDEPCFLTTVLQKRLNASSGTMSRRKRSSSQVFAAWSAEKDPDGIAWKVNSDGSVSPLGAIPIEVLKSLSPRKLEGLSNGDLAKRLGVDGSTLSHWKKNKSPDELIRSIQEKDPDGFEWIFNKETGRFIQGESSLPRMTQGELPTMEHREGEDF